VCGSEDGNARMSIAIVTGLLDEYLYIMYCSAVVVVFFMHRASKMLRILFRSRSRILYAPSKWDASHHYLNFVVDNLEVEA
jgi:hypothetical protein